MELKIAECCGTCIHCNKPRKPEDHEAHYNIAKTQRWCYFNSIKTTRECVCDNYEIDNKKGGVPACKRIFKFNERAKRIIKLVETMQKNNIDRLEVSDWSSKVFVVSNNWLYEEYHNKIFDEDRCSYYSVDSCSNEFDKYEKKLWENLNKLLGENNG